MTTRSKVAVTARLSRREYLTLKHGAERHRRSLGAELGAIYAQTLTDEASGAMVRACEWLRQGAPGRALEELESEIRRRSVTLVQNNQKEANANH
jgi:hypothetical protein